MEVQKTIEGQSKIRAERNRTITISNDERRSLMEQLSVLEKPCNLTGVIDKTFHQDLFSALDFMPTAFADLIVVDPPYNLSKDFAGLKFKATDEDSYMKYVRSWLPAVLRLLKPTGSIYVCCDWNSSNCIYTVLKDLAIIKNRITWQREKGRGAKTNWKNSMEDIWFAVLDEKDYYFDVESVKQKRRVIAPYKIDGKPKDWEETAEGNFRLTYPSNFWDDISIPYWSMPENTDHPTQKPEKLIAKLVLASCPPGGIVFDPFLGSGTTSVVAKKLGRHFCGVEINECYALLAAKRLLMAETNTEIQGYSDGVFWERNTLNLQKKQNTKKTKNQANQSYQQPRLF